MFECQRCGYETDHKCILLNHLNRKTICHPINEDIERRLQILELTKRNLNTITFDCDYCGKQFNHASTKCKHKKTCKHKPVVLSKKQTILHEESEKQKQIILKLQQESEKQKQKILKLEEELQFFKSKKDEAFYQSKKDEAFYQSYMTKYLKGRHVSMKNGITDITNDNLHAELKSWNQWKDGVGQLLCYNREKPRDNLHIYLFGKLLSKEKDEHINTIISFNIYPYEMKLNNLGFQIIDLKTNKTIETIICDMKTS